VKHKQTKAVGRQAASWFTHAQLDVAVVVPAFVEVPARRRKKRRVQSAGWQLEGRSVLAEALSGE
jgi:hypothetical protein